MSHSIIIIHVTVPTTVNGVVAENTISVEYPVPHDLTPEQVGQKVAVILKTLGQVQSS